MLQASYTESTTAYITQSSPPMRQGHFMTDSRRITYASYASTFWQRVFIQITEAITGRARLQKIYDALLDEHLEQQTFWQAALNRLGIKTQINNANLDKVRPDRPLIVIANHPFGVVDGLIICELISRIRPNFKVVLNHVLCQDQRIDKHILPIEFAPTREAKIRNLATRKACLQVLAENGTIIIFPAGGVATASNPFGNAEDLEWKPFTTKLVEKSQASVLPIYFHGQNSTFFQIASKISETLRIGLLVYEVNNKCNSCIQVEVGDQIEFEELTHLVDSQARTDVLRNRVFALKVLSTTNR